MVNLSKLLYHLETLGLFLFCVVLFCFKEKQSFYLMWACLGLNEIMLSTLCSEL